MQNKYQTINTFTRTPSPAQIVSYIIVCLEVAIFYSMIMNSFKDELTKIIFIVLFSVSTVAVFATTIYCSFSDPSDSTMISYKNGERGQFSTRLADLLYCDYCQSYVEINSRHCRQCQRCVENFDHHCMWINNCIGSKNYKVFIMMIFSTCTNMLIFLASVLVLSLQDNWNSFLGFMITSWSVAAIVLILAVLLVNLILLHIYLICKGYTTYQFIIARRQQQRRKTLIAQQEQAQKKRKQNLEKHASQKQISRKSKKIGFIDEQIISKNNGDMMNEEVSNYGSVKNTPLKQFSQKDTKPNNTDSNQMQITNQAFTNSAGKEQNVRQFEEREENIFGGGDLNDQKSEAVSVKLEDEDSKGSEANMQENDKNSSNIKKRKRKESDEYAENTDEEDSQIKMSGFFTRNKSLGFLVGQEIAARPKKKYTLNISSHDAHPKPLKPETSKLFKSDFHNKPDTTPARTATLFKDKPIAQLKNIKIKNNSKIKRNVTIEQEEMG